MSYNQSALHMALAVAQEVATGSPPQKPVSSLRPSSSCACSDCGVVFWAKEQRLQTFVLSQRDHSSCAALGQHVSEARLDSINAELGRVNES